MDLKQKARLRAALHAIHGESGGLLRDFYEYLNEPLAPDEEIDSWPLWVTDDWGGVWCGDPDCPLQAENSEIGEFRGKGFTFAELRHAIGEHIALRRRREADNG